MPYPVCYMFSNHVDVRSWCKCVSPHRPRVIHELICHSTYLQVPFLNLMALIRKRAGEVRIRVGGNTQETAVLVDSLPGGVMLTKEHTVTGTVVRASCMILHLIVQLPRSECFRPRRQHFFTQPRFCIPWQTSRPL